MNELEIAEIYVDESSQTKNRFLLIGGIIIPSSDVAAASEAIKQARLPELPYGEMKWGKVSKAKYDSYRRVVDLFFDNEHFQRAHFHCLIVDTHQLNHARFNSGSREIGFNKEVFQISNKFARLYKNYLFHLYPDYRQTQQKPDDLRNILNHYRHKSGDRRDWPFRRCQFRDSAETAVLQLVDLLLGSVAFGKNEHFKSPNASLPKTELGRVPINRIPKTARF
jgi:hypothetical protein